MTFHREFDNDFDGFAVTGKTLLPGKLAPPTVGHVPRKLSRYIWYALRYGAIITAEVKGWTPKEISISARWTRDINWNVYCMVWCCQNKKKRKEKLEIYQIGDYADQSNEILREMSVDVDEEGDKES